MSHAERQPAGGRRTGRTVGHALGAALGAALFVSGASAAAQCGDRADLLHALAAQFDERPVASAVDSRGIIVEWTVAPSDTWTMLATVPGQPTCIVAAGEGWHTASDTPLGEPS